MEEYLTLIWDWLGDEDHRARLLAIIAALGLIGTFLGWFFGLFKRSSSGGGQTASGGSINVGGNVKRSAITGENKAEGGSATVGGNVGGNLNIGYTLEQHEAAQQRRLDELRADLEAKHAAMADASEAKQELLRRDLDQIQKEKIAVQGRLRDLDASYAEVVNTMSDLKAQLDREGNDIGGDRLAEARAALERGDFSKADALFAEIEARKAMAVQSAARAAFGRGEIAEEQVRWEDAAEHYARAAGLDPTYDTLFKAREFAWRAGDYARAVGFGAELIRVAREGFGDESTALASALNEHAGTIYAIGRYAEAEPLFRQALEIGEKTIGTQHPTYAIRLSNLAGLLLAMGRTNEAEPLYRQALEIGEKTIGTTHPGYAIHLNNLASLLRDMGRLDEAEPLFRQALEIDAKTIGTAHPDYAIHLNNLALLLRAMGRTDEAEPLYRQALEIDAKAIGTAHPGYATGLLNLAVLLQDMGRYNEAEPFYVEALEIFRVTLGPNHPNTKKAEGYYAIFLANRPAPTPD